MNAARALIWKEWRSIRGETLGLTALAAAWTLLGHVMSTVPGYELWNEVTMLSLASGLLPGIALLLGATTTAGDAALSFAAARPASRTAHVLSRIGVRLAALAAVTLVAVGLVAIRSPDIPARLATAMPWGESVAWTGLAFAGMLVVCFAAACLASAHVERPLAAAFVGGGVAALLYAITTWAFGAPLDEPRACALAAFATALALLALGVRATAERRSEAPLPARRLAGPLGVVLVAAVLVVVGWPMAVAVAFETTIRSSERDIVAAMPAYAGILERHPGRAQPNEAHRRLVIAALPLGIDFKRGAYGMDVPNEQVLATWRNQQMKETSSLVSLPRQDVLAWIDARQPDVENVRAILLASELPQWPQASRLAPQRWAPEPWCLLHLGKMLEAHALAAIARGNEAEALADLEVEWRIARALAADADASSQLFAVSTARRIAVALRKLPAAPAGWDDRLDVEAWRAPLVEGLLLEAASAAPWARRMTDTWYGERWSRAERWFMLPIRHWKLVSRMRGLADAATLIADPRRCGPARLESWTDDRGDAAPAVSAFDHLRAQVELTRATFAVRRARAADPSGAWPTSMPGIEASACESLRCVYTPGDVPSIHAEGEFARWVTEKVQPGARLPLRVELH